jgi:hypothetical protein
MGEDKNARANMAEKRIIDSVVLACSVLAVASKQKSI